MDSPNITKIRKVCNGFVKGANLNLISLKEMEDRLNIHLGEGGKHGTTVQATQYGKLDDTNLMTCHLSIIREGSASSDGIVIQTSTKNKILTASLPGDLQYDLLGEYYTVVANGMDVVFRCSSYDKLLIQNNVQIN